MEQFIENCFAWPTWPATMLLLCVCGYWLMMMLGAVDLDFLDIDLDLDMDMELDADPSILQFGFIPLKFLNIGSVPTMLWVSVFSLTGWMVSRLWNSPLPHESFLWKADTIAIIRDFGIAALMTKAITQPLRGRFDPVQPNMPAQLVGRVCVVTTTEVSDTFGEADLQTDAAPLKLKIRNNEGNITKGDHVVIVDFRSEDNIYFVRRSEVV
ncbi:MAG: hypothetical protein WAO83_09700 [Fuerstiella sp.]